MAGELLEAAAGMLVLRGDRGGAALLGLLVEETHVVHAGPKARTRPRFPPDLAAPSQPIDKWRLLDEPGGIPVEPRPFAGRRAFSGRLRATRAPRAKPRGANPMKKVIVA